MSTYNLTMNCYSRYFSLTDVRTERVEKPKFVRSTSLGTKSCDTRKNVVFSAPFSFEEVATFEEIKTISAKPKKMTKMKFGGTEEESCGKPSVKRNAIFFVGKEAKQLGDNNGEEDLNDDTDSEIERVDVCTTVSSTKRWCQCFKELNNAKTIIHSGYNKKDPAKLNNMMGQWVEDVPTEMRCPKCHLEIQEEPRRRKKVIDLWMEFFGSRGNENSIYRSGSSAV